MSSYKKQTREFSTNAIHVPYEAERSRTAVVPPITTSVIFRQEDPDTAVDYYYGRCGQPTREHLEIGLASLEGAKYGVVYSSGMAAVAAVVAMLKSGDHVISSSSLYSGTTKLFSFLKNINVEYEAMDFGDLNNVKRALKPNTRLVYFETPTNPQLDVIDIEKCCQIAHSQSNVIVVVDNTFLTPYFQRPLKFGADIVIYSLTKYMNGHSDVVMGAALTDDNKIYKQLECIQRIYGAVPSPFDCYQVSRGLKTLSIRMEKQSKSALNIAEFLQSHPAIERVMYPGLPSHPQYKLILKQCTGHSGMITFYIKGGLRASKTFVRSLKIVALVSSLGGVETIVAIPSLMTHGGLTQEMRDKVGITDNLVRLSVGLEEIDDLIQDIDQALKVAQEEKSKL